MARLRYEIQLLLAVLCVTRCETKVTSPAPTNHPEALFQNHGTSAITNQKQPEFLIQNRGTITPSKGRCHFVVMNGYLKEQCTTNEQETTYKCASSPHTEYYFLEIRGDFSDLGFNTECPEDDGAYQVCGFKEEMKDLVYHSPISLCGYKVHNTDGTWQGMPVRTGGIINMCDNKCDDPFCEDESYCNGFEYGMYCVPYFRTDITYYLKPNEMCSSYGPYCLDQSDTANCYNTDDTHATCLRIERTMERNISLRPEMRCSVTPDSGAGVCDTPRGMEQTNCSDTERVAILGCKMDSYPVTISIFGYCHDYSLCDDNYNNICLSEEIECTVHKGQLCDGHKDCNSGSDEKCSWNTTDFKCERRFHTVYKERKPLFLPMSWVMDGVVDCLDGRDENEKIWKACGNGINRRYMEPLSGNVCQEVLICPGDESYIEMGELCDRVNTCPFENTMCDTAIGIDILEVKATVNHGEIWMEHCFPNPVLDLERQLGLCHRVEHIDGGLIMPAFDVTKPVMLTLPEPKTKDCSFFFGENYLYAACNGRCANADCPLKPVTRDTCNNYKDHRVLTLAKTVPPDLLPLLNIPGALGLFENRYFPCANKNCVLYKDVCNLIDDCKDESDEVNCTNFFKCTDSDMKLPKSSVCNGRIECTDMSDECHENCPSSNKNIFVNNFVRGSSYTLGGLATLLNLICGIRTLCIIRTKNKFEKLINTLTISLVCLGDLLFSGYLIAISSVDFIFRGTENYCEKRFQWLTSKYCIVLGVISTIGSQLSLFAITILSLIRLSNANRMVQRSLSSFKSIIKIAMLTTIPLSLSVAIAVVPVLPFFDDYFVNGLYYGESPLFLGPINKARHVATLNARIPGHKEKISWKEIRKSVKNINTCPFENTMCDTAIGIDILEVKATVNHGEIWMEHCFPHPVLDLERQLGLCHRVEHIDGGLIMPAFDVTKPVILTLPEPKTKDCSFFFGENYLYAACNGRCANADCPLKPVTRDTCNNYKDHRVLTLAKTVPPDLLPLLNIPGALGLFENRYFPCANKNCVLYKDVCNLIDDCVPSEVLSFYGNDGVCIFKYLVTRDDPQWAFSTFITFLNFVCFVFIAVSYIILAIRSHLSAQNVGIHNPVIRKNQQRLQRKVTAIIVTDFFCWIPLCTVSFLHVGEVIDATPWYAYFSAVILPINCVINPILYDRQIILFVVEKPFKVVEKLIKKLSQLIPPVSLPGVTVVERITINVLASLPQITAELAENQAEKNEQRARNSEEAIGDIGMEVFDRGDNANEPLNQTTELTEDFEVAGKVQEPVMGDLVGPSNQTVDNERPIEGAQDEVGVRLGLGLGFGLVLGIDMPYQINFDLAWHTLQALRCGVASMRGLQRIPMI
eukprot:sb/3460997/